MTSAAASAAATAAMAAVREATAHYHNEDDAGLSPSSVDGHRDGFREDDDPFRWGRGGAVLGDVPDASSSSSSSSSRREVPVPGYAPSPPPPLSPPRRSGRRRRQWPRQPLRTRNDNDDDGGCDGDDDDEIRDRIAIELENVANESEENCHVIPSEAEEERRHEVEQHAKVVTGIEWRAEDQEEAQEEKVEKEDTTAAAVSVAVPVAVATEADPRSSIEIDERTKEDMFHRRDSIDLVPAPASAAIAAASRRNCRPHRRRTTSGGEGRGGGRSSDLRRWSFSERHDSHRHCKDGKDSGNNYNSNSNSNKNKQERRCSTPSTTMASSSSSSTHPSIGSNGSSKSKSKSNNHHPQHRSNNEAKTGYHTSHHQHQHQHQQQQQQQQQQLQLQQPRRNGKDIQTRRQTDKHPFMALSMKTTLSPSSSSRPRTTTPRRRRQTVPSVTLRRDETPTHPSDLRSSFAKGHGKEVIRGSPHAKAKANTKANAYHRQSSASQSRVDASTFRFDSRIHRCRSGRGGKDDDDDDDDDDDRNGVGNANDNGGGGTVARSNHATKSWIPLEKEMKVWKNDVEARTFRSEVVDWAEGKVSATLVAATATVAAVAMPSTKQPTQRRVQQMQQSEKKCVRRLGVPVLVTKTNF